MVCVQCAAGVGWRRPLAQALRLLQGRVIPHLILELCVCLIPIFQIMFRLAQLIFLICILAIKTIKLCYYFLKLFLLLIRHIAKFYCNQTADPKICIDFQILVFYPGQPHTLNFFEQFM